MLRPCAFKGPCAFFVCVFVCVFCVCFLCVFFVCVFCVCFLCVFFVCVFCVCFLCVFFLLVDFFPRAPPPVCHRPRTSLTPRFQGPSAPYAFGGVSFLLSVEDLFIFLFIFFGVDFFPRAPPPVCYRPRTSLIRPCLQGSTGQLYER